jgi:DNA mismatch repair protein MutS2
VAEKVKKKLDSRYREVGGEPREGDLVLMRKNNQVGMLKEIRGKKAIVQLGAMPITIDMSDLLVVEEKPQEEQAAGLS